MISPPRREWKCRLNAIDAAHLRREFSWRCRPDRHGDRGSYFVRSLYLDTSDLMDYVDREEGESCRFKTRLRVYGRESNPEQVGKVEIKSRRDEHIVKYSETVNQAQLDSFVKSGSFGGVSSDVLIEFERITRLQCRRPKVLVDYLREAWTARDDSDLRLTLDSDLQYAAASSLYPQRARWRKHRGFVFEIKTSKELPRWVERLIHEGLNRQVQPNSKYVDAINLTNHEVG